MSRALRFAPPSIDVGPELAWALLRAFGPAGAPPPAADLTTAIDLALALGLGPRIGSRARLAPELVAPDLAAARRARELCHQSTAAAASELRALEAARQVAAAAARAGIRPCFLKGVALDALGLVPAGGRGIGDVDVLVAPAEAARFAASLAALGFVAGGTAYPHQLPAMTHGELGTVEIHRHVPGVRVGGARSFATLPEISNAGLVQEWATVDGALLPSRELLAAHLLAHGIAQHGFRPDAYPLLRMLADLVDLGFDDAMVGAVTPLLTGSVEEVEVRAAAAACRELAAGRVEVASSEGDAGRLLRHFIAAHLDDRYRESLKLAELRRPLAEGSRAGGWVRSLGQAVWLSRSQVDAIYGPQRHAWGYAARRAWRPFDLLLRAVAAARARRR